MGLLNVFQWNGGDVADAITMPKPAIKSGKLAPKVVQPTRDGFLAEYALLAKDVGIPQPDLGIEAFKDFLRQQDWGVFSLADVVAYMDKKAAAESKEKAGWQWRPLREKDHMKEATFGTEGRRAQDGRGGRSGPVETPASDYYEGPRKAYAQDFGGTGHREFIASSEQTAYDKTIPLHALRKVAAIEKGFKSAPVAFFVCDYAPLPEIEHPDPFLMAAINNPKLNIGVGRFILDFWDEPGFGLDQMLGNKS